MIVIDSIFLIIGIFCLIFVYQETQKEKSMFPNDLLVIGIWLAAINVVWHLFKILFYDY